MRNILLTLCVTAGVALFTVSSAFSQALNPTPKRESKLVVGFETTVAVTADPLGSDEKRGSINTDAQFVAEGKSSLKLDLSDVGAWHDVYFAVDLPEPLDIKGHQILSMDVFVPAASLNPDSSAGSWWQFSPRITTTAPGDDSSTSVGYYANRDMVAGWNHLIWDLKNGTDTKLVRVSFAGNTNPDRPYSGPIYVDNIRVYKGTFHGIQPDEKLVFGFENPTDKDLFTPADEVTVAVNTDKQFIRDGNGSLKIDLTGQGGGWTNNVARANDFPTRVDVTGATALHIDIFVPDGNQPEQWNQLGFAVIGEGGEVGSSTIGFVPGQWNTLEIPLTSDQAKSLAGVKGLYFLRHQGSEWRGPVYADNLRAVFP